MPHGSFCALVCLPAYLWIKQMRLPGPASVSTVLRTCSLPHLRPHRPSCKPGCLCALLCYGCTSLLSGMAVGVGSARVAASRKNFGRRSLPHAELCCALLRCPCQSIRLQQACTLLVSHLPISLWLPFSSLPLATECREAAAN